MITAEEILSNEVRALSWKQPFAELMFYDKEETRTWNTKYRGLVLICASAISYDHVEVDEISGSDQYQRILEIVGNWNTSSKLPTGVAVGIGRLVSAFPMLPHKEAERRAFVKFRRNLFAHVYEDVTRIKPFPWKGIQGWKTLTQEEKQLIFLP